MKRKIGIGIFLFIIICSVLGGVYLIIGIGPGQFDYEYNVGNGDYVLHRSSAHDITITPKNGYSNETEIIPEKVVEIAWNNKYVIAKQYSMKRESQEKTYEVPDETVINYWILDTQNRKRYGPFSYEEFSIKLLEFNLNDLNLNQVRFYEEE